MRVQHALLAFVQAGQTLSAAPLRFHGAAMRLVKHHFAIARQRGKQRFEPLARQVFLPQAVKRVDDDLALSHARVHVEHHVTGNVAVVVVVAPHVKHARHGQLRRRFADFQPVGPLGLPRSARGRQLVHAAKRRLVERARKLCAHAPAGRRRAFVQNGLDGVFVQVVGQHDAAIGKSRRVEHAPRHLRQPRQVARVDADAGQTLPALAHFKAHGNGVFDALLHVVRVHQQHAVVREFLRVGAERRQLVGKRHHPRMRVRARHRQPVALARQHVRRGSAAAHHGGAACPHAAAGALSAA